MSRSLRLAVAVVLLAGTTCSRSPGRSSGSPTRPPPGPWAAVPGAAARTIGAGTARVSFAVTITPGGVPAPLPTRVTGAGVVHLGTRTGAVTVTVSGAGADGVATVEALFSGSSLHQRLVAAPSPLPESHVWVRIEAGVLRGLAGVIPGTLANAESGDPTLPLQLLRASAVVSVEGKEELAGVDVTRYRAAVRPAAAAASAPSDVAVVLGELDRVAPNGLVALDVWLDGEGRVRKLDVPLAVPAADGPEGLRSTAPPSWTVRVTTELVEFGVPVDVEVPTGAGEVVDVTDLLGDGVPGDRGP